jgi:imidazole glycerol-phosphate synthase subunit HisF
MFRPRVIPCLLLKNRGLVKTQKFKDPKYLGDPINIVKIFNDKEVDELFLLDITATLEVRAPQFSYLAEIASECFMPLGYGGGIRTLDDVKTLLNIGIEKVAINSSAILNPSFIRLVSDYAGSQSTIVSLDIKKSIFGKYEVFTHSGTKPTGKDPITFAREMEKLGAGEIFLNSIDKDGAMQGYDIDLINRVTKSVGIPVVACGGAGNINHLVDAVKGGASAAAAGSMFVFQGPLRGVLISYPDSQDLQQVFFEAGI